MFNLIMTKSKQEFTKYAMQTESCCSLVLLGIVYQTLRMPTLHNESQSYHSVLEGCHSVITTVNYLG